MKKQLVISFRLPEELIKLLKDYAEKRGVSAGSIVRLALSNLFEKK